MDMKYSFWQTADESISCLERGTAQLSFFSLIGLLREPTRVFTYYFKEFEASYKARKALKIYFQSHKTLKSSCNAYK